MCVNIWHWYCNAQQSSSIVSDMCSTRPDFQNSTLHANWWPYPQVGLWWSHFVIIWFIHLICLDLSNFLLAVFSLVVTTFSPSVPFTYYTPSRSNFMPSTVRLFFYLLSSFFNIDLLNIHSFSIPSNIITYSFIRHDSKRHFECQNGQPSTRNSKATIPFRHHRWTQSLWWFQD